MSFWISVAESARLYRRTSSIWPEKNSDQTALPTERC